MKIAITDACIFIDLHDLDLTNHFFKLDLEIHTSLDVFNELYPEHRQLINAFRSFGKFKIHNLLEADRIEIMKTNYPRSLSEMDKTVLYLAVKYDAMVLSGDKVVRNYAKLHAIDYHGILWLFEQEILSKTEAAFKLRKLIAENIFYQNNGKLMQEFKKRLELWEG